VLERASLFEHVGVRFSAVTVALSLIGFAQQTFQALANDSNINCNSFCVQT